MILAEIYFCEQNRGYDSLSYVMKVSIQGQPFSYHDIATRKFFGDNVSILPCETFSEVFENLSSGRSDICVVAVENSLYGPINPVYDLLLENKAWVYGEIFLRIEHCLIGLPTSKLSDISEVHSQVMAIGQCEKWLENNLPHAKHIEEHDTTASVVMVKQWGDPSKAAIASEQAANAHNMHILAKNVEDHHQNFTRFFVLSQREKQISGANKTSLILQTAADTRPGALHKALGVFAERNINIYSLHSRPIVGKAWHYMFYIDVGVGIEDSEYKSIITELESQNCHINILGSYKNGIN